MMRPSANPNSPPFAAATSGVARTATADTAAAQRHVSKDSATSRGRVSADEATCSGSNEGAAWRVGCRPCTTATTAITRASMAAIWRAPRATSQPLRLPSDGVTSRGCGARTRPTSAKRPTVSPQARAKETRGPRPRRGRHGPSFRAPRRPPRVGPQTPAGHGLVAIELEKGVSHGQGLLSSPLEGLSNWDVHNPTNGSFIRLAGARAAPGS